MILATASPADEPRTETIKRVAWVYAAILVLMAVAQLFAFEKFIPLVEDYWLVGGHGTATLVATVVVTGEVFALPSLLRMSLSSLMRWCSLACVAIVPAVWFCLAVYGIASGSMPHNGGMIGTKVAVPLVLQAVLSVGLGGLAAWSIRGLWPARTK